MFDKNYAAHYNTIYEKKPYQKDIEFIYSWAGEPLIILDLGCGTTNYWQYWKDSYVFGVDKSNEMLSFSKSNLIWNGDIQTFDYSKIKRTADCVTAIFDVINYLPKNDWWHKLPLRKDGNFIFDIWDKNKVDKENFKSTTLYGNGVVRCIYPERVDNTVTLRIRIRANNKTIKENHTMYLYSEEDIIKFCGKEFVVEDKKETKTWQTWYKLRKL